MTRTRAPLFDHEWSPCPHGCGLRLRRGPPLVPPHWRDATPEEREQEQGLGPLFVPCEGGGVAWR